MLIETHRGEYHTNVTNLISTTRRGTNTVEIYVDELIQYETGAVIVLRSDYIHWKTRDGVGFTPRDLSLHLGEQVPGARDLGTRIALEIDHKRATDPFLRQPLLVTVHVKLIRDRRYVIPPPPSPDVVILPTPSSSRGASSQVFERLAEEQRVQSRDLVGKNETLCSICIDDLSESRENIIELPRCLHIFHQDCLFEWLSRKNSCPLCRRAPYEYDQETLTDTSSMIGLGF